jgi:multimeric flavodoxin WrbA
LWEGPNGAPSKVRAIALVCSLNRSPAESSSELLARQLLTALGSHDVQGETVRIVDHDVKPGVQLDMGGGDEWPGIREKVIAADILIVATPTWMASTPVYVRGFSSDSIRNSLRKMVKAGS